MECEDVTFSFYELEVFLLPLADDEVILNYMNNGVPWAANQIDISALGTVTDSFVYIVRDIALMEAEFPSTTFNASNTVGTTTSTNGDDGYQKNGADVFKWLLKRVEGYNNNGIYYNYDTRQGNVYLDSIEYTNFYTINHTLWV